MVNKQDNNTEIINQDRLNHTPETLEDSEVLFNEQKSDTKERVIGLLEWDNLKPFYKQIVKDLKWINIDEIPNDRESLIYKYIGRITKPLIKDAIVDIYNWREEVYNQGNETFGFGAKKLHKDKLVENKNLISSYLEKTLDDDWKSVYNHTQYFETKYNEYYNMYETTIVKRIQQDIEVICNNKYLEDKRNNITNININNYNISKNEFRNIIINVINEFLYVIYAFWDKLNINEFESIFVKQWINQETNKTIDNDERKSNVEGVVWMTWWIVKVYNSLQEYPDLLEMYKSFIMTWLITEWELVSYDFSKLAHEIEKHFKVSLNEIADIYKHWYYSEESRMDDLMKIRQLLDTYINNISVLKQKDLAFSSLDLYNIWNQIQESKWLWSSIKNILWLEDEKKGFIELVSYLDWEELIHLNRNQYTKLKNHKIIKVHNDIQERRLLRKSPISFIDIDDIELYELNFHIYNEAWPDNRKKYFLKNVYHLDTNWYITWNNFLTIEDDSEWLHINFAIDYVEKHKWLQINEDQVLQDLEEALNMVNGDNPIHVTDFEKKYLNYEQILVSWFRYCLHSKDSDGNYNKQLHWPREKIWKGMTDKWLIDTDVAFTDWELKNSTIWNLDELIKKYNQKFRKRPINLKSYEEFGYRREIEWNEYDLYSQLNWLDNVIKDWEILDTKFIEDEIDVNTYIESHKYNLDEKKKIIEMNKNNNSLFKDISELYIPEDSSDIKNYKTHISWFIKCIDLILQRKDYNNSDNETYIKILRDNWIPINNLETIYKLKKFLKYIEYMIPYIEELKNKSIQDYFAIEKFNSILSPEMIDWDNKQIFEIWKPKSTKRIFEKVIWSYSWDIRDIWDLVRMRYIGSDLDDTYEKLVKMIEIIRNNNELNNFIIQGIVEDNIWNNSERGPKETQYRDLKIQFKTNEWNLIEVQFMVNEIYQWKEIWLAENDLSEVFSLNNIYFDQNFITELENRAIIEKVEIPMLFMNRIQSNVITRKTLYQNKNKVNSDDLYKLWRWSNNKKFSDEIKFLESLIYQVQWWKIIAKQTEWFLEEFKNDK